MKQNRGSTTFRSRSDIVRLILGIIGLGSLFVFAELGPVLNAQTEKDRQDLTKGRRGGTVKKDRRRGTNKKRNRGRNARGQSVSQPKSVVEIADAVRDFSISLNPNGVWSYGWASARLTNSEFIPYHNYSLLQPAIHKLYISRDGLEDPSIIYNALGAVAHYYTGVLHPPDLLNLRPGPNGERSILRWTSPKTGTYQLEVRFQGIDKGDFSTAPRTGGTNTNVTVIYKNSMVLFNGNVDDYGKEVRYNPKLMIYKGETIDFSVGLGNGSNYKKASTGLTVRITPI